VSFNSSNLLHKSFYKNPDVVDISQRLIGKVVCTYINSVFTSGIITETEAYCGRNDKACHANNGLRTARSEVMYGEPGHAYIYLCYGIHHLLNVVTNKEGLADAVLIRAIRPLDGLEKIRERRGIKNQKNLTNGPGKLTQALGVTTDLNTVNLSAPPLWIEDRGITFNEKEIKSSPRIGVDYAEEDALKPWRFFVD
jgi:DNA-3-methyladenine glycosylase